MHNEALEPKITLNNDVKIPVLGLGVWKASNVEAADAVSLAISHGYVLIDTAKQYGNEQGVGDGIQDGLKVTGKNRDDLFITTKVYSGDQGYQASIDAIDGQLERLQTDHVDLLLMHWPVTDMYNETWRGMEEIYRSGKARAIGVCNFDVERLTDLLAQASVTPAVNQMEFNPLIHQQDVFELCQENGIQIEAWSPLGNGKLLGLPLLQEMATAHKKTPAQVILRWEVQSNVIVIPKSVHEDRIVENADIFDFSLTDDEMKQINQLNEEKHSRWYDDYQWYGNPAGDPNRIMKA